MVTKLTIQINYFLIKILSFCAKTAVPLLHYQNLAFTAKFLSATSQLPSLPIIDFFFSPFKIKSFKNNQTYHMPLILQISAPNPNFSF